MTKEQTQALQTIDTSAIEAIVASTNHQAIAALPALQQAVALASGIAALKRLITKEVNEALFVPLAGSKLGFLTDKDKTGGYDGPTIRECIIEGLLYGLRPIGNEINIISGQMYPAKNGLQRLVSEYPGLTNLELIPGVPFVKDDRAVVPYLATWLLDGERMAIECKFDEATKLDTRIPVTVNRGMGPDAVLGKAERKMLAKILRRVSGSKWILEDGEAGETTGTAPGPAPLPPEQDGKRMRLGANGKGAPVETTAQERQPGEEG